MPGRNRVSLIVALLALDPTSSPVGVSSERMTTKTKASAVHCIVSFFFSSSSRSLSLCLVNLMMAL